MRSRAQAMIPAALLLLLSACATTEPPATTSSEERGEPADPRIANVEERLDRFGERLQDLDNRVAAAQSRADDAARKAEGVDHRLTRLWSSRFNQKTASSLEVYFSPDSIQLTDAAQTALVWVARELQAYPTLTVELGGYTDARGALDYNYGLSQRRVDAVRTFLVDKGIQLSRIQAASLGPLTTAGIPDAKKRRVTVRLLADLE